MSDAAPRRDHKLFFVAKMQSQVLMIRPSVSRLADKSFDKQLIDQIDVSEDVAAVLRCSDRVAGATLDADIQKNMLQNIQYLLSIGVGENQ